jgi:hypothetical protein
MEETQTFISIGEIREFYKEKCNECGIPFSEEESERFVKYCEIDIYDWLSDNWSSFGV